MQEKYEVVKDIFHGFDYKKFFDLKPSERVSFIPDATEYILKEKGKHEEALSLRVSDAQSLGNTRIYFNIYVRE